MRQHLNQMLILLIIDIFFKRFLLTLKLTQWKLSNNNQRLYIN